MTTLRDPFEVVHRREGKFDYVSWSQVADRLDDTGEPWSFSIMGIGEDWVHGRLTIGERHYENIGYAENASADWKKEALKDASSDSFKRCAALAGVARYLYDKDDSGAANRGPQPRQNAPQRTAPAPRPHLVDTDLLDPGDEALDELRSEPTVRSDLVNCPIHDIKWIGQPGDLYHRKGEGGFCRHPDNIRKQGAR